MSNIRKTKCKDLTVVVKAVHARSWRETDPIVQRCSFSQFVSYLLSVNAINLDAEGILESLASVSGEKLEQCCKLIPFLRIYRYPWPLKPAEKSQAALETCCLAGLCHWCYNKQYGLALTLNGSENKEVKQLHTAKVFAFRKFQACHGSVSVLGCGYSLSCHSWSILVQQH